MVVEGIQPDLRAQVAPAELSRQWSENTSSSHTHLPKRSPFPLLRGQRPRQSESGTELFQGLLVLSVGQDTWPPVRLIS